jgi:hypothetical protein
LFDVSVLSLVVYFRVYPFLDHGDLLHSLTQELLSELFLHLFDEHLFELLVPLSVYFDAERFVVWAKPMPIEIDVLI